MSARQDEKATVIVLETFASKGDVADPLEEFQSALIVAYEQALEQGISPCAALAVIVDMTFSEMQRI
jgi:hypothetical protein